MTVLTVAPVEAVSAGQIWQECDNRRKRFVRILRVFNEPGMMFPYAEIETVCRTAPVTRGFVPATSWMRVNGTRVNKPALVRFNGRHGGYRLADLGLDDAAQ